MRTFFSSIVLAVMTFAGPAQAEDQFDENLDAYNAEDAAAMEFDGETPALDDELEQRGWNRWICRASSQGWGWGRTYWGASQWFQEGSGQGRWARQRAAQQALRNCRYYSYGNCYIVGCQVQRT